MLWFISLNRFYRCQLREIEPWIECADKYKFNLLIEFFSFSWEIMTFSTWKFSKFKMSNVDLIITKFG